MIHVTTDHPYMPIAFITRASRRLATRPLCIFILIPPRWQLAPRQCWWILRHNTVAWHPPLLAAGWFGLCHRDRRRSEPRTLRSGRPEVAKRPSRKSLKGAFEVRRQSPRRDTKDSPDVSPISILEDGEWDFFQFVKDNMRTFLRREVGYSKGTWFCYSLILFVHCTRQQGSRAIKAPPPP